MDFSTFIINRIILEIKKYINESDIEKLYKITINIMKKFNIIKFNDFIINKDKIIKYIDNQFKNLNKESVESSEDSDLSEDLSEDSDLSEDLSEDKYKKNKCTKYVTCMSRLKTFLKWQLINDYKPFITPFTLSQAGFYYTDNKNIVKCFDCEIEIGDWKEGDIPLDEHKKRSSHCDFINSIYVPKKIREKYQKRFIKSLTTK
jgi:hypothetical protein